MADKPGKLREDWWSEGERLIRRAQDALACEAPERAVGYLREAARMIEDGAAAELAVRIAAGLREAGRDRP